MPDTCDAICRLSLAHAVCSELLSHQGVIALALTVNGSSLVAAGDFRPLLRERSALLSREFGCTVQNRLVSAPPMQQKSVADGKSGSGFLVGGGDGVSADQPSSYGVLLKQLSPGEAALLPSLLPRLMDRYASGSLLARFFGWVRYADPARGRPFEAVLMDNVARPPPGIWPGSASRWRPFDMKGIRLYKNERRFEAAFGQRGLRLAPRDFAALRRALELDVRLLTSLQLVDYSYLLSVVAASPASPRACGQPGGGSGRAYEAVAPSLGSRARRTHGRWDPGENGGDEAGGVALAVPKLIEACYCANASAGAPIVTGKSGGAAGGLSTGDAGGRGETVGDAGGEGGAVQGDARNTMRPTASAPHEEATGVAGQVGGAEAGGGAGWGVTLGAPSTARWPDTRGPDRAPAAASGGVRCERVLVRLALIDYLREWRLVEIGEHVQKTLQRDLFARERNHAVVPVSQFGRSFTAYFSDALFAPLPPPRARLPRPSDFGFPPLPSLAPLPVIARVVEQARTLARRTAVRACQIWMAAQAAVARLVRQQQTPRGHGGVGGRSSPRPGPSTAGASDRGARGSSSRKS